MTKKEKLLEKKLTAMNENSYNDFDNDIKNWLIDCLSTFKMAEIEKYDAWKAYRDVDIKKDVSTWVSYQGAEMETVTQEVTFYCFDKEFKNSFEKTRGNW